jgi:hypothetical protein
MQKRRPKPEVITMASEYLLVTANEFCIVDVPNIIKWAKKKLEKAGYVVSIEKIQGKNHA